MRNILFSVYALGVALVALLGRGVVASRVPVPVPAHVQGQAATSPAAGAVRVAPPRRPGAGELSFDELMIAPAQGPEWIELRSLVDRDVELGGCVLAEGATSGEGGERTHVVDERGGRTVLPAGGRLLMARGDPAVAEGVAAAYTYRTLTLNNRGRETLRLRCGDVEVATVDYDWAATGGARGSSWVRDPASAGRWCVGETPYPTAAGGIERGTPGAANPSCGGGGRLADGASAHADQAHPLGS